MDVLPVQFRILRIFGLWYESERPHWLVKYIWRPLNLNILAFFTFSQLGALTVYRDNIGDFTECLFLSLTFVGMCFKIVNWLGRRATVNRLLDEFRARICRPRDAREREMIAGYERIIAITNNVQLGFTLLNNFTFSMLPVLAMAAGDPDVFLPYKTYEFVDKSNPTHYWLTYAFEVVADTIGIFVNISFDMIFAGLMLLTCGQIDLCCHRFASSCNDEDIRRAVKECVVHQLSIWRIVRKLEAFFMSVVVLQMFLSLITLCTSVYNVSQSSISGVEAVPFFIYLVCLLCQLCCYCWFGNELKLKSTAICDTIYNSDWTALSPSNRKSLHIVMLSCQREMTISFHGLCALTLEIFVWVLKTSYSAYNLLTTVEN